MRRLLRIGEATDRNAVLRARSSTRSAIVLAGIRCTITYLLIPLLAPAVALIEAVAVPLSIALSLGAIVMGIVGVRRFWIADHHARWRYTAFIAVIIVLLCAGLAVDLTALTSGSSSSA